MGKRPPKWLPGERVNETILTQRKSVEQLRADRVLRKDTLKDQRARLKARSDLKRKKRLATKKFVPAQAILKQAVREERRAKGFFKRGETFTGRLHRKTPERVAVQYDHAPVALVVRICGTQIPRAAHAAFARLGLEAIYKARLIHLNPANDKTVKQLKTFTSVGFPTAPQLEHLIRTRGAFWNPETKSKSYISGNLQVENVLGHLNVLTVEELVDAVTKKADGIDQILSTLAPFDFHPPRKLFIERHRSPHQKLEIANPASFERYLQRQLTETAVDRKTEKAKALARQRAARKETATAPKSAEGAAKQVVRKSLAAGKKRAKPGTPPPASLEA